MRFTGNNEMLIVYRGMQPYTGDAPVDIMLTPQFYMVKKEPLPVRTRYRAKKIAPSLFNGLTEAGSAYEYFVYPEGDMWVFIAYDPKEIMAFLKEKGLENEKIAKVYFAEQLVSLLEKPMIIGEKDALAVLDNMVVLVPRTAVTTAEEGRDAVLPRPKRSVYLENASSQLLSRKQSMVLTGIFALLGLIWFAEGWRFQKNNRLLLEHKASLYVKYPSLESRYTRESILAKYRKVDEVERKKRKLVGEIAGLIFKGVTVETFDLGRKGYKVVFSVSDPKVAKRLISLLQQTHLNKNPHYKHPEIVVEGKL